MNLFFCVFIDDSGNFFWVLGRVHAKPTLTFAHSKELAQAIAEGRGPKLRYVVKRARSLAREGHKVLIWSSFVKNVEFLSENLQDLGAVPFAAFGDAFRTVALS